MCDGCSCHIAPPCSHCVGDCDCPKGRDAMPDDAVHISVFADGDQYCAVFTETFRNLQESEAGFGLTQLDAIASLIGEEK